MLWAKLPRLERWNARRRAHADRYRRLLAGHDGVALLEVGAGGEPVHHLLPVRVRERDGVRGRLAADGIETGVHYPCPPGRSGAYRDEFAGLPLPNSDTWAAEELSLPMGPALTDAEVDTVAASLLAAVAPSRRPEPAVR